MFYSRRQGLEDAQFAIDEYNSQAEELQHRLTQLRQDREDIVSSISETLRQVVMLLLPSNEEAQVAAEKASCPQVMQVVKQRAEQLTKIRQTLLHIEANSFYQERESLGGTNGLLQMQIDALQEEVDNWEKQIAAVENDEDLQWLQENPKPEGLFGKLGEGIIGRDEKREDLLDEVMARYKVSSIAELKSNVASYRDAMEINNREISVKSSEQQQITDLVARKLELKSKLSQFDEDTYKALVDTLVEHLQDAAPADLRGLIERPNLLVGKLGALNDKLKYLRQLEQALEKERNDRLERAAKVQNVRMKWRRSSRSYLKSDKSNWLRTLPSNKHASTTKWLGHYDSLYGSVWGYDNYLLYFDLMDGDIDFLPFAVFSNDYDGNVNMSFAQQVMPEFAEECEGVEDIYAGLDEYCDVHEDNADLDAMEAVTDDMYNLDSDQDITDGEISFDSDES